MNKIVARPLKAFLCHASGDKPPVRELYKRLVFEGVDAWLDKEKLLPGQDWRVEIPRAVQEADVVIVFLSKKSVSKEGYVQKEIKFALDIAEEKPEGTIFLIPARLEECLVPERLSRWQWVDLFEENGFIQLLRSLKLRARAVNATVETVSYEDTDRESAQRAEQLYTEGLAAFYTEEWDRACQRFQAILSEHPNHKNATEKLAEAEKQRGLTRLYARAELDYKAENWQAAIQSLEDLLQRISEYKDAIQLLRNAKKQKRLGELYAEARALHSAQKWQAVIKVFEQISAIEPANPDPDALLPSAHKEVTELKRLADLNDQYSLAVRRMDAGQWLEARTLLEHVHKSQTGFLETERLLKKVDNEIAKVEDLNRRRDQVNMLYEQAHGLIRSRNWRKVLDKIEEIQGLDSQFEDKDGITEQAKAELAREEQGIQRQNELAAMYAESVKLMQEGKYQEALDKWNEVKAIDPKYPDRQGVQRTAKKKQAEMTKPVKVNPRVATKKPTWRRAVAFAGITICIVSVVVLVRFGQQMLSSPTSIPTRAAVPFFTSTKVPVKTSTLRSATIIPVTGGYSDSTMYDDFDASGDNLDTSRWDIGGDDPASEITRQSGILTVKTNGYGKGVGLSTMRFQELTIREPFFIESRFMLEPNQNGGAGIFLAASNNKGFTLCQIWGMLGRQSVVCQSFLGEDKEIGAKAIASGTWHSARIEVDPSTMIFVYYIDGVKIGEHIPGSADELKSTRFSPSIGSGCSGDGCIDKNPRTVTGYFDNVRMGAIKDDLASQEPFIWAVGEWEAADVNDKSRMTMSIKRVSAGQYTFFYTDYAAGFCDNGMGRAEFKSDTFSNIAKGTFEFVCDSFDRKVQAEYKLTYNRVSDQLVDAIGIIWDRKK
jgi:outer membrane protein assembly factor BamD (BamD/ComL family)